jgi:hypothetical protein
MAKKGKTERASKPKSPTAEMKALVAEVAMLLAARCAVFGIPPDPDNKDFWRLMTYSLVLEHLVAEHTPPARGKKTKPIRWTDDEKRRLLGLFGKEMAGGKRAGGKTVTAAAEVLAHSKRVSSSPENLIARYYEAKSWQKSWQRDRIAEALLSQSETPRPGRRAKANKKSPAKSTNS